MNTVNTFTHSLIYSFIYSSINLFILTIYDPNNNNNNNNNDDDIIISPEGIGYTNR